MTDINIGEISEALNGKQDILTPPQSDYLIESYTNGTSWYRLYKSG